VEQWIGVMGSVLKADGRVRFGRFSIHDAEIKHYFF
jgi:hypothetical protein